jgi:hypothetical protein
MEQAVEHGADGGNIAEEFSPVFNGTAFPHPLNVLSC